MITEKGNNIAKKFFLKYYCCRLEFVENKIVILPMVYGYN